MPTLDRTVARDKDTAGNRNRRIVQYNGPASYATGGDPFVAADVALGVIEFMPPVLITDGTTFRVGIYNYTTQKLQFFVPNTNVEVAAAVNLSTFSARIEVIGK